MCIRDRSSSPSGFSSSSRASPSSRLKNFFKNRARVASPRLRAPPSRRAAVAIADVVDRASSSLSRALASPSIARRGRAARVAHRRVVARPRGAASARIGARAVVIAIPRRRLTMLRCARAPTPPTPTPTPTPARGARARVRRASTRARALDDDDARRDSRFASEDERRRAVERLAPPKRDGDRAKPRLRELGKKRAMGFTSGAASSGAAREAARRARLERRDARATRESREIMSAMRDALDAWESEIDGMTDFARASVLEQASTATEMFERLRDEGFGAVESAFAVMSWMDDAIEDAAARADEDAATSTSTSKERVEDASKASKSKTAPDGVVGALSDALRQWFAIDITELEDGRKSIVVNASAEFLAVFILLLVASAHFGGELVSDFSAPDPLLR